MTASLLRFLEDSGRLFSTISIVFEPSAVKEQVQAWLIRSSEMQPYVEPVLKRMTDEAAIIMSYDVKRDLLVFDMQALNERLGRDSLDTPELALRADSAGDSNAAQILLSYHEHIWSQRIAGERYRLWEGLVEAMKNLPGRGMSVRGFDVLARVMNEKMIKLCIGTHLLDITREARLSEVQEEARRAAAVEAAQAETQADAQST